MEVQCPKCQSKFHLPDSVLRPNVKLRCSVCKNVFRYEEPAKQDVISPTYDSPSHSIGENLDSDAGLDFDSSSSTKAKKEGESKGKGKIIISLLVLLLCLGGGGGVWWYMFKAPQEANKVQGDAPKSYIDIAKTDVHTPKSVEMMTMRDVRQYSVDNEKVGKIFVIEGKVVNYFPTPKELIKVEAGIYAVDNSVIMSKNQLAGATLTPFQLKVLSQEELESNLHNEIEILTKNTNVPSNGEVEFMVLFYNPPQEVSEFGVKIFSARDVKKE